MVLAVGRGSLKMKGRVSKVEHMFENSPKMRYSWVESTDGFGGIGGFSHSGFSFGSAQRHGAA
jgi:hypothetical protein